MRKSIFKLLILISPIVFSKTDGIKFNH